MRNSYIDGNCLLISEANEYNLTGSQMTRRYSLRTVWWMCCLRSVLLTENLKGFWVSKATTTQFYCYFLSFRHSFLLGSLWVSPFQTSSAAQLLTYKIRSLSTCVERHGKPCWWWDLHAINDLEKGRVCWEGLKEGHWAKGSFNGWCVDVFQMLMCHFRTKVKVCALKARNKWLQR